MAMGLNDRLNIKEFDVMVADTLQNIVNANVGITNVNPGSVVRTLVESILDNNDMSNYYISYVYNAMSIDDATGDDLDRLVAILSVYREGATFATGVVTMDTGSDPAEYDIPIPFGSIISTRQDSNGNIIEFSVSDSDAVLLAGTNTLNVNVVATEAGHIYIPAGSLSVLNSSILGIQTVANIDEINSGTDAESDDELRIRTKTTSKSFGKCTDSAIKLAVESIQGVLSCTVLDMMNGVGTTGVIVSTSIVPPPTALVNEINTVVKATKASGIGAFIIYPTIKYINIVMTITGADFDDDTVLEALSNYVNSLDIGQTFIRSQAIRKVANAIDTNFVENDDVDVIMTSPSTNQISASTEIVRIQTVTINGTLHNIG